MTADTPSPLVPRLRFPEFEEKAAWSARPLTNVVRSISSGLSLTQTNGSNGFRVTRIETIADGTVDINRVGRVTTDQDISSYRLSIGDILVSNINSMSHIGKSVLIDRYYDLYHGMNLLRIEALSDVIYSRFLYYWLNTEIVRASIRSRANKAVNQASINQTELGNTVVLLPLLAEQQTIADCLGALDDLIAAEGRKLEALRQHKQGLMQQLFPQPGETVPRLRFPDFQNAGAWEEEKLDDLARQGTGHTPKKAIAEYYNGGIKWVSLADSKRLDNGLISETEIEISEEGINNSSAVLHPAGSVILSRDAGVGKSAIISCSMAVSQHFIVWTCEPTVLSNWFLYYQLQLLKPLFERIATGSTIKTIGLPFFNAMRVTVPRPAEQHRIADCLSMLEARLAAQVQKLNALKTHKQGLLQQLFPPLQSQ